MSAYLKNDCSEVGNIIAEMPEGFQQEECSQMVLHAADLLAFQAMFSRCAITVLTPLIDGELDDYIREYDADNGIQKMWRTSQESLPRRLVVQSSSWSKKIMFG